MFPELASPVLGDVAVIIVMSDGPTSVGVNIPDCGGPATFAAAPGAPAIIPLCFAARVNGPGFHATRGISIVPTPDPQVPLKVLFRVTHRHPTFGTGDAYLGLPVSRLGSSYRVTSYPGNFVHGTGHAAWIAIAAEPDVDLEFPDCDGVPIAINLPRRGDVYQLLCPPTLNVPDPPDPTGDLVWSPNGKKFGLIAGNSGVAVPVNAGMGAADALTEMLLPADSFGNPLSPTEVLVTEFNKITQPFPGYLPGDIVRIVALDAVNVTATPVAGGLVVSDNTACATCGCNPLPNFALAAGQYCDIDVQGGARITTPSGRIRVMQVLKSNDTMCAPPPPPPCPTAGVGTGDPSSVQVLPTTAFSCAHRVWAFGGFPYVASNANGTYLNIVAPQNAIASTRLNGTALSAACPGFAPINFPPPSTHAWVECRIDDPGVDAEYLVEGWDGSQLVPIGVYPYGQGAYRAWVYPASVAFP